jgi:predicted SprT family Zn-dependent metalloprotease
MKYHPRQVTVEITGHRDGMNASYLAHSELVAKIAHIAVEQMYKRADFLSEVNTRRFIKHFTSYCYPEVDWSGQYVHRQRKVKINARLTDIEHVIDVIIHEMAHCWYHNAEFLKMDKAKQEFKKAILADLGSIDSYSRGRKLKSDMKKRSAHFVNEIHSIMTELKYGTQKFDDLVTDEDWTHEEKQRLQRYIPHYDKLHPEKSTQRLWINFTNQS